MCIHRARIGGKGDLKRMLTSSSHTRSKTQEVVDQTYALFDHYDADGDYLLSFGELPPALQALGVSENPTHEKLVKTMAWYDGLFAPTKGKLDFSEFLALCIEIKNAGYELPDAPPVL